MLNDVAQIRRIVNACGVVDHRKGIDVLVRIIGARYHWIHLKKEPYSFSAVEDPIV